MHQGQKMNYSGRTNLYIMVGRNTTKLVKFILTKDLKNEIILGYIDFDLP